MATPINLVASAHGQLVHSRRVRRLAEVISGMLEPGWSVLDIGCGDGALAAMIERRVEQVSIEGCDVLVREHTAIPVHPFDGRTVPRRDGAVDAVLLVDVLHHTDDPLVLLREAARVASTAVIIKDHRLDRPLAAGTLRCMDWIGNHAHGVALPYNYWPLERWRSAWSALGLEVEQYTTRLGLYPWPASWCFERGLHFVTRLRPT